MQSHICNTYILLSPDYFVYFSMYAVSSILMYYCLIIFRALTALNDRIRAFQVLSVTSDDYAKEFAQIQAKYKQVSGDHHSCKPEFAHTQVYTLYTRNIVLFYQLSFVPCCLLELSTS